MNYPHLKKCLIFILKINLFDSSEIIHCDTESLRLAIWLMKLACQINGNFFFA